MRTFQVNDTAGGYREDQPSVATLAGGGYVVAWHSGGRGVCSHRFTAAGTSIGTDACITGEGQFNPPFSAPAVAGLTDGGYVIAYSRYETGAEGLWVQRYDAAGNGIGAPQRVNHDSAGVPAQVSAVALPNGGYAVAWNWNDYPAVPNRDLFTRIFTANGDGGTVQAAAPPSTSPFDRKSPALAALAGGGFVLVWADADSAVRAQLLQTDGRMRGAPFQVNAAFDVMASGYFAPRVAPLATGGFVVTWTTSRDLIAAMRVYDANGNAGLETAVDKPPPLADPTVVCRYTRFGVEYCRHTQTDPVPAQLPDGTFVVAYMDSGTPTPQNGMGTTERGGMYVRRFNPDGTALTNSTLAGSWAPRAAAPAGGFGFVVTWDTTSNQQTSNIEAAQFSAVPVR